ncbi:MAG TPA: 3-oxoacyl-ACP reductase FabG [Acidimicrobiales bacterium]|nr:3-oxoacyl-ACP reductase FabG [Acidimicrobiales bacterium]
MSTGRVVVVTGASRGIGRACAEWFAERGDRVAALSSSGTAVDVAELSMTCDVADSASVDAAFTEIESVLGPAEVLVANAGITVDQLALRMTDEAWDRVLRVNLSGAFFCARRALRRMVRAHGGRIVFVSSVGAFLGVPGQANYAASKAGLVGVARSLAREVASRGVTVNVVAPGLVDTDMLGATGEDRTAQLSAMVPLGRVAAPAEVASLVGFVASGDAGYVTGAVLPIDGGLSMGL